MHKLVLGSIALLLPLLANAKDCPCEQHKAGATGKGSCTLTESSTRCSISYEGSTSSKESAKVLQMLAKDFRITRAPNEILALLNQKQPELFTAAEFREVFVASLVVAPDYNEKLVTLSKSLDLGPEIKGQFSNSTMKELFTQFQSFGCIDKKIGGIRYLMISQYSKFDAGCK